MKDYRVSPFLFLAEVPHLITGRPAGLRVHLCCRQTVCPGAVAFISLDLNFLICSVKLSS